MKALSIAVLVLLGASIFIFGRKEIELEVPIAKHGGELVEKPDQTILDVKVDGTVAWDQTPVPIAELQDWLAELARVNPRHTVILRGNEHVAYKGMVNVLDICRNAGIWNVAFATDKPE